MRRAKLRRIPRKWLIAGTTFVTTALIVLLVANLSLGDKHIDEGGGRRGGEIQPVALEHARAHQ